MTAYAIWSLACNDCETHYPASPDQINTELAIVRAALADGWERRNREHRCPACIAKALELGYRLARGACSVCGVERALNANGSLRMHDNPPTPHRPRWNGRCDGSRKMPATLGATQ